MTVVEYITGRLGVAHRIDGDTHEWESRGVTLTLRGDEHIRVRGRGIDYESGLEPSRASYGIVVSAVSKYLSAER